MTPSVLRFAVALLPFLAAAASAQTRPPIPSIVLTHMNSLDARCKAAGGRPGAGRYVIAQDFTGDGRLDYLLSEGDYVCTGRPGLFRQDGQARVDIFVTDRSNNAPRVYSDTLIGYRVLAGKPAKVQIARKGALCGQGSAPDVKCAAQLAWNGQSFGEGVSVSSAQQAPASASPAGAAPGAFVVAPGSEDRFRAECRKELVSRDAGAARWADDECKDRWGKIVAAGPAALALLAVLPASPGERPSLATVKQRAAGVRWLARAAAPALASGEIGGLHVGVQGRGQPASVAVNWSKQAAEIPYDVAGAMRVRGVTMTQQSCEKIGSGAGTRVYAGTASGRAPFTLTVEQQTAPLGHMESFYVATVSLDGRHQPRGPASGCDF